MAVGTGRRIALAVGVAIFVAFSLFPVYWMAVTAFRDPSKVMSDPSLVPGPLSVANFRTVVENTPFLGFAVNSVVISVGVSLASLVLGPPIGYVLARSGHRLTRVAGASLLLAYMIPEIFVVIPVFIILGKSGLVNTRVGLGLGLMTVVMPLVIWLMRGFFRNLPRDVEDAAVVDGASGFGMFFRVVVPMARPGIITAGMFAFIFAWTDYIFALTLTTEDSMKTLPVGLSTLYGEFDAGWGAIMAAGLCISLPMGALVGGFSRYLVSGLTAGATNE